MYKVIISSIFIIIFSMTSFAAFPVTNDYLEGNVTCVGVNPISNNMAYFDVEGYRFAFILDESSLAKARYATILSAFNSGNKIRLYGIGNNSTPTIEWNWGYKAYSFTSLETKP